MSTDGAIRIYLHEVKKNTIKSSALSVSVGYTLHHAINC